MAPLDLRVNENNNDWAIVYNDYNGLTPTGYVTAVSVNLRLSYFNLNLNYPKLLKLSCVCLAF